MNLLEEVFWQVKNYEVNKEQDYAYEYLNPLVVEALKCEFGWGQDKNKERANKLFENAYNNLREVESCYHKEPEGFKDYDYLSNVFFSLGFLEGYGWGNGGKINGKEEMRFYEQAANIHHSLAKCKLGDAYMMLSKHLAEEKKEQKKIDSARGRAELYYYAATEVRENPKAIYMLGVLKLKQNNSEQIHFEEVLENFKKAANYGDVCAQTCIGIIYLGLPKERRDGENKAAGARPLGLGMPGVETVAEDKDEGYYRLADIEGPYAGLAYLGERYFTEGRAERDYGMALAFFEKAAEQGSAYAHTQLGYMYDQGIEVEQDKERAIEYYQMAACLRDVDAQVLLCKEYIRTKKYAELAKYAQQVVNVKHPEPLFYLGDMCQRYSRQESDQYQMQANKLFIAAAKQGHPASLENILKYLEIRQSRVTSEELVECKQLARELLKHQWTDKFSKLVKGLILVLKAINLSKSKQQVTHGTWEEEIKSVESMLPRLAIKAANQSDEQPPNDQEIIFDRRWPLLEQSSKRADHYGNENIFRLMTEGLSFYPPSIVNKKAFFDEFDYFSWHDLGYIAFVDEDPCFIINYWDPLMKRIKEIECEIVYDRKRIEQHFLRAQHAARKSYQLDERRLSDAQRRVYVEGRLKNIIQDFTINIGKEYFSSIPEWVGKSACKSDDHCYQDRATFKSYTDSGVPLLVAGVFDGHGSGGEWFSKRMATELPGIIKECISIFKDEYSESLDDLTDLSDMDGFDNLMLLYNAITMAFVRMNQLLQISDDPLPEGGCTACAAIKIGSHLLTANVGDSRHVVVVIEENDVYTSEQLSEDAKCDVAYYKNKIEERGGDVIGKRLKNPNDPSSRGKGVAMAFGGFKYRGALSVRPEMSHYLLPSFHKTTGKSFHIYSVLGTDGFYEKVDSALLIDLIKELHRQGKTAQEISLLLAAYASQGVDDDVTALVIPWHNEPEMFEQDQEDEW